MKKNRKLFLLSSFSLGVISLIPIMSFSSLNSHLIPNSTFLNLNALKEIDQEGFIVPNNIVKNLKELLANSDTKIDSDIWKNNHFQVQLYNSNEWLTAPDREIIYDKGLKYFGGFDDWPKGTNQFGKNDQFLKISGPGLSAWIGDWDDYYINKAGFRFNFWNLDTNKYKTNDGGNNHSVYFLNQYGGIRPIANSDNHVPNYYAQDSSYFGKYSISDDHMRWTDFYGVDLFNKWSYQFNKRPQRFGQGSTGELPDMDLNDFKNLEFNVNQSVTFSKSYYSTESEIYSGHGSRDKEYVVDKFNNQTSSSKQIKIDLVNDDYGWYSFKIKDLPYISELDNLANQLIKKNQNEYKGQKLYAKVSSYQIWFAYWMQSNSDTRSFDVNEAAIWPLTSKLDIYVSNESQLQFLNDVANTLSSNSFFTNSKIFETDDGANSLDPSKWNNPSLVRPSVSNDNPITTYQQYLNWQNKSWEDLMKNLNQYNFDQSLLKVNYEIILNSEAELNSKFKQGKLYLTTISNGIKHYYFIKTINFGFNHSKKYQNWIDTKSINDRLTITPSNWFRYDNGKYIYGIDEPIIVRNPNISADGSGDGGEYIYHGFVNIFFRATSKQDEILFVNDKPIDVLNNEFVYDLTDIIKKETDNEGDVTEKRENKYILKIVKYNQQNGVNVSEKLTFTKTITIQSYIGDNKISYFAWDPEFNYEQKKLIEKYLWDPATGDPLLDEFGNEIPNPNYNPEIDAETGTIKQLIWVNKKSENNEINFIPDPLDEKGELNFDIETGIINSNNFGFIAEAVVIPKGISIMDPDGSFIDNNLKLAKIGSVKLTSNENVIEYDDNKEIKNWKNLSYGNENTYLSEAGIYIFSDSINKNLSNVKVVGYGTSSSAYKKFNDEYQNSNQYGWNEFWTTYQGKHLLSYLKDLKGIDEAIAKGLNYQEIIFYWKEYVSAVIDENIKYRPNYSDENNPEIGLNDIFKNFPNEINIFNSNLEKDIKKIKEAILKVVDKEYALKCDLEYQRGIDWDVQFSSDEDLLRLAIMEYENVNPNPFKTTIKLLTIKNNLIGNKIISVKNTGSQKPNIPDNDLSKIELKNYKYEINSSDELYETFVKELSFDLLNEYNLVYGEFVLIKDLNQKIKSLFYSVGTHFVYLELTPLDEGIQGSKKFKLTNTTSKAEEFDLSNIYISRLEIKLTNRDDIYQALEKHIDKYLGQFSFYQEGYLDIYYQMKNGQTIQWNSNEFLRMLVAKNPPAWTIRLNLKVVGKLENIVGSTDFNIINRSGLDPFDPDKDESWNPNNPNNEMSQKTVSIVGGIFGSLAIVGIIIAIIFGLKIHYRNKSKKIK